MGKRELKYSKIQEIPYIDIFLYLMCLFVLIMNYMMLLVTSL